jgi:hypothetical protein
VSADLRRELRCNLRRTELRCDLWTRQSQLRQHLLGKVRRDPAGVRGILVQECFRRAMVEFIGLIGSTAAWPLAARAQQPKKIPRLGYLASGVLPNEYSESFFRSLRELGYIDGVNIQKSKTA